MRFGRNLLTLLVSLTPSLVGCGDAVVGQQGCFGKGVKCEGAKYMNEAEPIEPEAFVDIAAERTVSAAIKGSATRQFSTLKSDGRGTTWALSEATLVRLDSKGVTTEFDLGLGSDWKNQVLGNAHLSLDGAGLPVVAFDDGLVVQVNEKGKTEERRLTGAPLSFENSVYWIVSDRHGGYFAHTSEGLLGFDSDGALRFRQTRFIPEDFQRPDTQFQGQIPGGAPQVAVASDGAVAALLDDGENAYWLVCLELDGNTRWARAVGGTEATARVLTVDADDNFILALSDNDRIELQRLSPDGKYLEGFGAQRLGYPSVREARVAVDREGTILVTTRSGTREKPESTICHFNSDESKCIAIELEGLPVTIGDLASPAPGMVVLSAGSPLIRVKL